MSYEYVFFLGAHRALSATELSAVLGADTPMHLIANSRVALVTSPSPIAPDFLDGLGGCDRFGALLARFEVMPSAEQIVEALGELPTKKWQLGVSLVTSQNVNSKKLAVDIKKAVRAKGSSLAFILPKSGKQLNAAQVRFNGLVSTGNAELTLVETEDGWLLVRTESAQDIAAYELRDTKRPGRDAQVGMLPPKVAQIMLNIALGALGSDTSPRAILDPFCGMGTVLQEGWLKGHQMVGSDASDRMITYTERNMQWLYGHFKPSRELQPELLVHDIQEPFPSDWQDSFDLAVTEPFLGKPLSSPLPYRKWEDRVTELQRLYLAFFRHSFDVLKDNGFILALLPVITTDKGGKPSPTPLPQEFLDSVGQLGYSMEQFVPPALADMPEVSERNTLVYGRPDALVRRELTLWKKR